MRFGHYVGNTLLFRVSESQNAGKGGQNAKRRLNAHQIKRMILFP